MNTTPLMTANEERRRIEEEQRRRAEEEKQKREVQRKSLETAVEDKIKRQLQNVLERAKARERETRVGEGERRRWAKKVGGAYFCAWYHFKQCCFCVCEQFLPG